MSLEPGTRVRRGIDWCYGDQDGVAGSIGTVTDEPKRANDDGQDWFFVKWSNGYVNNYRYGPDVYDIEVVGTEFDLEKFLNL